MRSGSSAGTTGCAGSVRELNQSELGDDYGTDVLRRLRTVVAYNFEVMRRGGVEWLCFGWWLFVYAGDVVREGKRERGLRNGAGGRGPYNCRR